MRVLSRLFRRLFLKMLAAAHKAGRLNFFGDHAARADTKAFTAFLAPLRRAEWVVYAKRPFGGPEAVLAYLARYTHRVAIANSRLVACGQNGVTFKWKDYRIEGPARYKSMTLPTHEFIRRFLMHVLPEKACTASATTDCSPVPTARPTSNAPANCSPHRLARRIPRHPMPQRPMSSASWHARALVVVAA